MWLKICNLWNEMEIETENESKIRIETKIEP